MLVLESDVLEVSFNGKVYNLRYPTVDDLDEIGESREIKDFKKFFTNLGMCADAAGKLQVNHAEMLVEKLTEKKN